MPKQLTLEEIAKLNPHIDINLVRARQTQRDGVERVANGGRVKRVQPRESTRVHIDDSPRSDPRTLKLHTLK